MSDYLHILAESLRAREKMLEDHTPLSVFDGPNGKEFKKEYDDLLNELKAFEQRLSDVRKSKQDYDEHFEKQIMDETHSLSVKIDSWSKNISA